MKVTTQAEKPSTFDLPAAFSAALSGTLNPDQAHEAEHAIVRQSVETLTALWDSLSHNTSALDSNGALHVIKAAASSLEVAYMIVDVSEIEND